MPRTTVLSPTAAAVLAGQDGVISQRQLAEAGFSVRAVNKRIERGVWRRLLSGVVLTSNGEPTRRQLLIAACLWAGPCAAVDGLDACAWYGLSFPDERDRRVHIVVPSDSSIRSRHFVRVRRAAAEIRVGDQGYVPYVDPGTALIVAARRSAWSKRAITILSTGLQSGLVTVHDLREARERIGDKWCAGVDSALTAVGVGLRSPAERDNHDLVRTSRVLPEPRWNQWLDLGDGGPPVCADALWDDAGMVNELNSRAHHGSGELFEATEARQARLVAAGLVVVPTTPTQVRAQGSVVLERLERTYAQNAGRGLPPGVRMIDPPTIAR